MVYLFRSLSQMRLCNLGMRECGMGMTDIESEGFHEGILNRRNFWMVLLHRVYANGFPTFCPWLYGNSGAPEGFPGRRRLHLRPELAIEGGQGNCFGRCRGGSATRRSFYQIPCEVGRVWRLRRHPVVTYRTWKRANWECTGSQ